MSLSKIYKGFYTKLNTIVTVVEGQEYTPIVNTPYQELYLLPSSDDNIFINEAGYQSLGLFQISLYYPISGGMGAMLERVEDIKAVFKSDFSFVEDGLRVNILRDLEVVNLGVDGDRFVYAIRVKYKALVI